MNIQDLFLYSKKLKVLYVEDDKSFAQDTVEILENFFDKVDLSVNGQDALDKYNTFYNKNELYYDIVITDIFMPKMNGLELTKEIYKIHNEQSIIVISAHNEVNYLLEFINIGIEHFIVKPFDINEIMSVLYKSSKK